MTPRRLVALNRGLWVAAAALLAASLLVSGYWSVEKWLSRPKPLQLPALDNAAPPAPKVAALPARNPFDPAGVAWQQAAGVALSPDKKPVAGLKDVRGVLASSTVSGVFTASGLIRTGEPFGGGTLEKVSREELVLRMPDGTTQSLQLAQRAADKDPLRSRLLELFEERP